MQKYTDLNDIQAEASVIATLLHFPEMILHSDFLKPNMFSQTENGSIYWAIGELYKAGIDNIDCINLNNQLKSNGAVKRVMYEKGLEDIQTMIDMSEYAMRTSLPEYLELCKTVCSYAYKRELYRYSQRLMSECLSENVTLEELDKKAQDGLSTVTERFLVSEQIQTVGEISDEMLQSIIDRQTEDGTYGIPSKFRIFDNFFQYEPGELIMFKARMKAGKSAILMNETINACLNGVPTLVIDSELDDRSYYIRMLANISQVTVKRIKTGGWSDEESARIKQANEVIKTLPLVHRYMPVVNDDEVYALCKILKYKMNLQFLVYDYIKGSAPTGMELSNKLGAKTDFLHNQCAGALQLCVLAACQLNREDMAAGSDQIDRYLSTSIMMALKTGEEIRNDGGLEFGNLKVRVDLNRNGALQDDDEWMSLRFIGDLMTVVDCKQPLRTEDLPFVETRTAV